MQTVDYYGATDVPDMKKRKKKAKTLKNISKAHMLQRSGLMRMVIAVNDGYRYGWLWRLRWL